MQTTSGFGTPPRLFERIRSAAASNRRLVWVALALAGVGAALYLGWGWLAAAGLTGLIVGLLPCALMCGAGLCASRFMGKGGSSCGASPAAGGTSDASKAQSSA